MASSTNQRRWLTAVAKPSRTSDWTCWSPVIFDIRVLPGSPLRVADSELWRIPHQVTGVATCRTVTRTTVGDGRQRPQGGAGILPTMLDGEDVLVAQVPARADMDLIAHPPRRVARVADRVRERPSPRMRRMLPDATVFTVYI